MTYDLNERETVNDSWEGWNKPAVRAALERWARNVEKVARWVEGRSRVATQVRRGPRARGLAIRTHQPRAPSTDVGGGGPGGDGDGDPEPAPALQECESARGLLGGSSDQAASGGAFPELPRDFVEVDEAAARLRVNPKTLYGAIAAGSVAGVLRVGPRILRVAPALMMGGPRPTIRPGDPDDITMTAEELVEYLQVDVKTIWTAAKRGELPSTRLGNVLRFSRARLLGSTSTGQGRGSRKIGSRK